MGFLFDIQATFYPLNPDLHFNQCGYTSMSFWRLWLLASTKRFTFATFFHTGSPCLFYWLTLIWCTDHFWSWSCIMRNITFVTVMWIRIRTAPNYGRRQSGSGGKKIAEVLREKKYRKLPVRYFQLNFFHLSNTGKTIKQILYF